ncbi:MCE family protein [Mycobacterium intracellulare]|uniref:MCE family protein n=1 Tax=Mycobacterium intracellulare TaxID=1767 RepID=UPI00334F357A
MKLRAPHFHIRPGWWTAILIAVVVGFMWLCAAMFNGSLASYVPVTVTSDRAGLVMESGAKVKLRGVVVGHVAAIEGRAESVRLTLHLSPDQINHIPANIGAVIRATTIFGAKYVDLIYPDHPSTKHIAAGQVLRSGNVSTEVDTVFESLVSVLHQIDPPKLNAVLAAVADAVRGRGQQMGEAITAANRVLGAVDPRMDLLQQEWRSLTRLSDAYGAAAQDIVSVLANASTTSVTVTKQSQELNSLLLNTIGFSEAGTELLGPNESNLVRGVNTLLPTTDLLFKYNPEYTCLLTGAKWWLENGGYQLFGGDGRTVILDDAFLLGEDPYRYPDNLPVVAAKGGPGGKPGCGSLPDGSKNYPIRQLITNTGWGTGLDLRPNPGIGFPGWANFLPVTRGTPQPPVIRNLGPPAPGPFPGYPASAAADPVAPYAAPQPPGPTAPAGDGPPSIAPLDMPDGTSGYPPGEPSSAATAHQPLPVPLP